MFHYSGHGSRVIDLDHDTADGLNSTLVPVDSPLPPGYPNFGGTVQDIMGHTLFLLMSALKTENVTVVLDCCHAGGGTRGNLRVRSLLATQIVKQILGNTNSSRINVNASMNIANKNSIVADIYTTRGGINKSPVGSNQSGSSSPAKSLKISASGLPQLEVGTHIRFQLQNNESLPLYISIFVIDAQGKMTVIFPNDWLASETETLIQPQRTLIIPQANDQFDLNIGEPLGISEALIIASTTPLPTALKELEKIAKSRGNAGPVDVGDKFLDVTNSLLSDLDRGTRGSNNIGGQELPSDIHGVDSQKVAAMGITFEVVGAKPQT